jgi:hypothetical protein
VHPDDELFTGEFASEDSKLANSSNARSAAQSRKSTTRRYAVKGVIVFIVAECLGIAGGVMFWTLTSQPRSHAAGLILLFAAAFGAFTFFRLLIQHR